MVGAHVREEHVESGIEECYPKLYYGFVSGLTEEPRTRVNAERADTPYGTTGAVCPPDCECGQ
ncbi:hypothetical protein [Streptomyces sp. NPDC048659]|uniref:hypothetical protein n=1 Tax=Streptomyces sp. NPDC048659 TaxID=3155489 RepID=UPI003428D3B2